MFEKEPPISLLANALPLLVNSNVQSNILMLLEWAVPNSLTKTFVCRLEGRWNQYRFYFWLLSAASKLCTVQLDCLCSCLSLLTFIYLFIFPKSALAPVGIHVQSQVTNLYDGSVALAVVRKSCNDYDGSWWFLCKPIPCAVLLCFLILLSSHFDFHVIYLGLHFRAFSLSFCFSNCWYIFCARGHHLAHINSFINFPGTLIGADKKGIC